jgi:hypothetical protein
MPRDWDINASRRAAEEAIGRVDEHAEPDFKLEALAVVHYVARHVEEFTTDRIWWELDQLGATEPHEPRALGPIMRRAQGAGWITDTHRVHLSVRTEAHRNPKRVWRSQILGVPSAA